MKKYASQYGKRILAAVLVLAMMLTMSSVDLQALAASLGGLGTNTNVTIQNKGSLGQVVTNGESTNEQVNNLKFELVQDPGIVYSYDIYVYQNTGTAAPDAGVQRKHINGTATTTTQSQINVTTVNIGNGDDGKPIVLAPDETLGVTIKLTATGYTDGQSHPIRYAEQDSGTGFRKVTADDSWELRGNIVQVNTTTYEGTLNDVTSVTLNPDKTIMTLGKDADVALNGSITPAYQRDIFYSSDNTSAVTIVDSKAHAVSHGHVVITAKSPTQEESAASTTKDMYVIKNTVQAGPFVYAGEPVEPTVTVECGGTLQLGSDYTLSYTNNYAPGTATVTVNGIGTYAGYSESYDYTIGQGVLTDQMVKSGSYVIVNDQVTDAVIGNLTYGVDYTATVTNKATSINSVTYTIGVTGKGNYTGGPFYATKTVTAGGGSKLDINTIIEAELDDGQEEFYYTGNAITPTYKLYDKSTGSDITTTFAGNVIVTYPDNVNASEEESKKVVITGTGNYEGTIELEYDILPRDMSDVTITLSSTEFIHDGTEKVPTVTSATYNGKSLTLNTDYIVAESHNKDVGTYTMTISAVEGGNFTGYTTRQYDIIADFAKDLEVKIGGATANYANNYQSTHTSPYTGLAITPRVSNVKLAGKSASKDDYYAEFEYSDNVNAGVNTAKVIIKGKGKYEGQSVTATFTITPKQLTGDVTVTQAQQHQTYTGNLVTLPTLPTGSCSVYDNGSLLVAGTDYELSYTNNLNAGTANVLATGKGNYTGTVYGTFTIDPLDITNNPAITIDQISPQSYTGAEVTPDVVVKKSGTLLNRYTDYNVTYTNNVAVAEATSANAPTATVTGTGNYTGTKSAKFTISPKSFEDESITLKLAGTDCTWVGEGTYRSGYKVGYTGLEQQPNLVIYDNGNVLDKSTNYTTTYMNNTDIGNTAAVLVTGKGPYAGSTVMIYFEITARSIADTNIVVNGSELRSDNKIYPKITVTDPTAPSGMQTLTEGTHYRIDSTVTTAGASNTAKVVGIGNYAGSEREITFEAGKDIANLQYQMFKPDESEEVFPDASGLYTFEYMGGSDKGVRPLLKVWDAGNIRTLGTHYSVTYTPTTGDGYQAGSYVDMTIEGIGADYYGTVTMRYRIVKKSIAELTIADGNAEKTADWTYTYNQLSKAVTPTITYVVKDGVTITLTADTDYKRSVTSVGPNVGTTDVTFTGDGNYTDAIPETYTINQCIITGNDDIVIAPIPDQEYKGIGQKVEPKLTITHKINNTTTKPITEEMGYTVTYGNNESPGTATYTVTGNNNYTGTKSGTFQITQRELNNDNTTFTEISDAVYNGQSQEPTCKVWWNGNRLTEGQDYTISYDGNVKVGVGNLTTNEGPIITVAGTGAYTGVARTGFTIRGNLSKTELFTVDGLDNSYNIVNGDIDIDEDDYEVLYTSDSTILPHEYRVLKKPSTIVPGQATLTVAGVSPVMYGSQTKTVNLVGNLNDDKVSIENLDESYDYTGGPIEPHPTVYFGDKQLIEGTDIEFVYTNNTNAGTANIHIQPKSGSTILIGSKDVTFKIQYNLDEVSVSGLEPSYDYTGSPITENNLVVKRGNITLYEPSDIKITYANNTNAGNATVTIEPGTNGKAKGSKVLSFKINPVSIATGNYDVTWPEGATFPYTGKSQTPKPVLKNVSTDDPLTLNTDYTISYPLDTKSAGTKEITLTGKGNYTGSRTSAYIIGTGDISDADIVIKDAVFAGGEEVRPTYTVTLNGVPLTEGVDFEYVPGGYYTQVSNDNSVTFNGIGNMTGSQNKTFNILAANIATSVIISDAGSEYDGNVKTPSVTATIKTGIGENVYTLVEGQDYTLTPQGSDVIRDAKTYTILMAATGSFIGTRTIGYKVTPKAITGATVEISHDAHVDYTGNPVRPNITVRDTARNKTLEEGTDYQVVCTNNVAAASATSANPPTITITGINNYAGTYTDTFSIGYDVSDMDVRLSQVAYTYNGQIQKPDVSVTLHGSPLTEGVDYSVEYLNSDDEPLDASGGDEYNKKVVVSGINGYFGEVTKYFTVQRKVASKNAIRIVPRDFLIDEAGRYYMTYTGADIESNDLVVYDDEISTTVPMDPNDYRISYSDNHKDITSYDNPAQIFANLQNNYDMGADVYQQPYYIKAKTIESDFQAYLPDGTQYDYTGYAVTPNVRVTPVSPDVTDSDLEPGVDYTLEYRNNVDAGTATVTVIGKGNFSGEVVLPYTIVADLSTATVTAPNQFYTGRAVHAPLTITCGGNTLEAGKDYTVLYTSDDNWEYTGKATITPVAGCYTGMAEKTYNIIFDTSLLTVTGYQDTYTFTGKPIEPTFVIKTPDGSQIMYDSSAVTYRNSSTGEGDTTSIGTVTATIPVTIGNKTGNVTARYSIISKGIAGCTIKSIEDTVYTGKSLTPAVYILDPANDYYQLRQNVDYKLTYSNNVNPGTARVVITGLGDYAGTVETSFEIIAPRVLGLKGAAAGTNAVTLSWLKNSHVSAYEIYSYDGKRMYGSTTDNTYTINNLAADTNYAFKVRSLVTVDGKTTYGEFADVTVHSGVSKPTVSGVSRVKNRATVNWNGSTNVSGYEIYRSASPNGPFSKIAVMPSKAGGYGDKGLTSGATYYYKVRAYDKVDENQFAYGEYSDVVAITIK